MDLVKLFTDTDPRGVYVVNLVLCLLGLLWIVGISRGDRDRYPWIAWVGFWSGTALFYLLVAIAPKAPFWIPQTGLYLGSAFLLTMYSASHYSTVHPKRIAIGALILIGAVVSLDVEFACPESEGSFHQTLTALAVGLWAWHIRIRDSAKSTTLLTYALIQLPVQPFLVFLGMGNGDGYGKFVSATYVLYAALKLPLIPVVCFVATREKQSSVESTALPRVAPPLQQASCSPTFESPN